MGLPVLDINHLKLIPNVDWVYIYKFYIAMSLIFLLIRHYYVILFITQQVSGISLHKITLLHNGSKIYGRP